MAYDYTEPLAPRELILPNKSIANPKSGAICLSGAIIHCWTGAAWTQLSGVNTGDV